MFDKLVGNSNVKKAFTRLIKSQRIPNSLLFVGEEGVGKKKFAMEIAKSQLCLNTTDFAACGECQTCLRAEKFRYPKSDERDEHKKVVKSEHADLSLVIPYNRNILVDAIRDLEREANFRPFEAKARFFIIDEAEKMNPQSANALLKTLEEPPETSFIFLISSRADSLLQTIISRCQIVRFAPIESSEIERHLLLTQKYSPDDAALLAKVARGSIGRAFNTEIEKFRAGRESMLKVLESLLLKEDRAALLQIAEKISDIKLKDDFEPQLETLQSLISDVWNIGWGKSTEKLVNSDIANDLSKFALNSNTSELVRWQNEIETLRENLKFNLNRKIATDALFMQMAGG
jgi:DNA polymerase III subunit delta'